MFTPTTNRIIILTLGAMAIIALHYDVALGRDLMHTIAGALLIYINPKVKD